VTVAAFESEIGVQSPAGFWDPLEFCKDGDAEAFKRRRTVEIKHGRISMYACIGYIVPEYVRFPGFLSPSSELKFTDVPNGLGAFSKVPLLGWLQILFFCGALERTGFSLTKDAGIGFMQDASMKGEPGNYGLGFIGAFNTIPSEPAQRVRKLNAELANGRLAMVAIIGMFFQNGTLGTTGPEMWGFEVTLDAFESELGVQSPAGFWDPLEFCKDGDAEAFKRRRTVEIKHGRISMYACIGYIVPEYARFPGYLSPSQELKFTDVPNGLAAFSKVPLLGWLQILFFCGALERTGFTLTKDAGIGFMQDASMKGEPGNYGLGFIGAFNTIPSEPALRERKLNSELANGRLAMVAIIGMLFQNGTLGTTGPEMWGFEVTLDAVEER